jgi:hypothetical protein
MRSKWCLNVGLAVGLATVSPVPSLKAVDSAAVKQLLANPPRQYATAPLWVWNDLLTEEQVRSTLRDLASQQVKQVFVHPRPGLMTPYLGPEWFRLWKAALDEAERLDMNVWIYDENSYPSGFAGGWVPELMPESRGLGLHLRESKTTPQWTADTVAVYRLDGQRVENISAKAKAGEPLPEGPYLVATIQKAGNSPWHGNRCYVNLLTKGVTEKFIEVTLEAYKREVGHQFGKRIPGVFTDEPHIRPAGGFPWCPDLPEQFQQRWGYNLLDHLPSLVREIGDWRKVRHDYFATLNDLFIERWAKPYYDWCQTNGLAFTGHYWDHEWPRCLGVPDNMAMAAWQQIPGIDCLMNQYAEHTHAQFGNVRFCREIASIANQLGRPRRLVELYGAGGWDLRFEDMKRIADWLQVLGINLMDEHLSYVTIRGARKRDHPQSFSYHEPWWEAYHMNARYLARLSAVMAQGEQINRILVLEPTTTAWMYQGNEAKLKQLGDAFFNLLMALETAQIEYDLGCEDVLARHGSVEGNKLRVGRRLYEVVVLPPHTENVSSALVRLGEEFLQAGVQVLCLGDPPARVDGAPSDQPAEGATMSGWTTAHPTQAVEVLHRLAPPQGFRIQRAPADKGILFHHRRHIDDGQILLLVNTSIEAPSAGTIESDMKGIERWNLYTGQAEPYPFETTATGVKAAFNLPPSGSLLLFLSKQPIEPAPAARQVVTVVQPVASTPPPRLSKRARARQAEPTEVRRLEPNVLTLDYVDITAGGETRTNLYFYQANQFAWQKNGLHRNPWDSAVQFKDELITRKFPPDSGFTASYRFTIEGAVPANLAIVIERPDLYTITCNGQPVSAKPGDWWLDKAFGRIPIAAAARVGENVVTLKAQPFTMFHELEPAYVLGDFTLRPVARGFVIAPDAPLRLDSAEGNLAHSINPDGTAWLSAGIGFEPGRDDRAPFVVFDLGQLANLGRIKVWNYNEAHVRDLTLRGADKVRITAGAQPEKLDTDLGTFRLSRAPGEPYSTPDELRVNARGVRYVRFDFLSNLYGVQYPASGVPVDNGFVGLSEVQFISDTGERLTGVRVQRCSSELASHRRLAAHLVDGSGLNDGAGLGWNAQGHPFYAHGVAYRQQFNLPSRQGRYFVSLSKWRGSVARVNVNGQRAGYIVAPPWECEVTDQLRAGTNTVEVVVFGTLKNTLGPHHGNPGLGSAWPGMFQRGPQNGPPPGASYSTVAYGLFEPFKLEQRLRQ